MQPYTINKHRYRLPSSNRMLGIAFELPTMTENHRTPGILQTEPQQSKELTR